MWEIERLSMPDLPWLKRVWAPSEGVLGLNGGQILWRALASKAANEHVAGVRESGFAHWRKRARDGVNVLYEIAVAPEARRRGIGRALVRHVGAPILLKTDAGNLLANGFYQALGFRLIGQTRTTRLFNNWSWEPLS